MRVKVCQQVPLHTSRDVTHQQAFSAVSINPKPDRHVDTLSRRENNSTSSASESTSTGEHTGVWAGPSAGLWHTQDRYCPHQSLLKGDPYQYLEEGAGLLWSKKKGRGPGRSHNQEDTGSSPSSENRPTCFQLREAP